MVVYVGVGVCVLCWTNSYMCWCMNVCLLLFMCVSIRGHVHMGCVYEWGCMVVYVCLCVPVCMHV